MPRRTTSLRRRATADALSKPAVAYFFSGPDQNNRAYATPEDARAAWAENREQLMGWWFNGLPADFETGYVFIALRDLGPQWGRPWAWWKFDIPEPRRLVSVWDGLQRAPTDKDRARANSLGVGRSANNHECVDGVGYSFEDDAEYFARLGIDPEKP